MKGIYIASITENRSRDIGVLNKIKGQIKGFEENQVCMDFIYMKENHIIYKNNPIKDIKKNSAIYFFKEIYSILKDNELNYDFAYIRYSVGNIFLLKLCKLLFKKNIKIIIELPTYPYEKELDKYVYLLRNIIKYADRYVTYNLKRYVNNMVSFIDMKQIFNISNLCIENGIDVSKIKYTGFSKTDYINAIAVANVTNSHGYDRFIMGLNEYYKSPNVRKVYFHLVGDGEEVKNLKKMVSDMKLEKYVLFYGAKYEPNLTDIYKKCNLGITALGMYRKDLECGSVLKAREYAARGIPFILGYEDKSFKNSKFVISVPNDDSYINIGEVVKKYDALDITGEEIRKYSETISWGYQTKKILDLI